MWKKSVGHKLSIINRYLWFVSYCVRMCDIGIKSTYLCHKVRGLFLFIKNSSLLDRFFFVGRGGGVWNKRYKNEWVSRVYAKCVLRMNECILLKRFVNVL